jgi:hypothetical protein
MTLAVGFTVIVNVFEAPVQLVPPFAKAGVTMIVATTGVVPPFVAVNAEIFPDPLPANPILGVSLVHE